MCALLVFLFLFLPPSAFLPTIRHRDEGAWDVPLDRPLYPTYPRARRTCTLARCKNGWPCDFSSVTHTLHVYTVIYIYIMCACTSSSRRGFRRRLYFAEWEHQHLRFAQKSDYVFGSVEIAHATTETRVARVTRTERMWYMIIYFIIYMHVVRSVFFLTKTGSTVLLLCARGA